MTTLQTNRQIAQYVTGPDRIPGLGSLFKQIDQISPHMPHLPSVTTALSSQWPMLVGAVAVVTVGAVVVNWMVDTMLGG